MRAISHCFDRLLILEDCMLASEQHASPFGKQGTSSTIDLCPSGCTLGLGLFPKWTKKAVLVLELLLPCFWQQDVWFLAFRCRSLHGLLSEQSVISCAVLCLKYLLVIRHKGMSYLFFDTAEKFFLSFKSVKKTWVPSRKYFVPLGLNYLQLFREGVEEELIHMTWSRALYACRVHTVFVMGKILLCWAVV